MSYKAPVISSIHNRTDHSFGISIQGKVEWLYPRGITPLYFDALSACYPKEEASLISLIKDGKVTVEILVNCGGTYNSIGFYDISDNIKVVPRITAKPVTVLKSSAESKDNYFTDHYGVKVHDASNGGSSFTVHEAAREDRPTFDPFTERLNLNGAPSEVPEVEFEQVNVIPEDVPENTEAVPPETAVNKEAPPESGKRGRKKITKNGVN